MLAALLLLALSGCGVDAPPEVTTSGEHAIIADRWLDPELVAASWPVSVATDEALGPYVAQPGWAKLVMERDLRGAVEAFGPDGGVGAARAHLEASSLYEQAAAVAAWSLIGTYGADPADTDPTGVSHLLTASWAMVGDIDAAQGAHQNWAAQTSADDPTGPWHESWSAWIAANEDGAAPDLSTLPADLGAVEVGRWPTLLAGPHYRLPEQVEPPVLRALADPAVLLAAARWHRAAARKAAAADAPAVDLFLERYTLPLGAPAGSLAHPIPPTMLFGADFTSAADVAWLDATTRGNTAAAGRVASDSLLAAIMARSTGPSGVDASRVGAAVNDVRAAVIAASEAAAGGQRVHHRVFADVVAAGLLRNAAFAAQAAGDGETAGQLRLEARERSVGAAACPVGLLQLAAWDASHRFTLRATDLLHQQIKRYPSLAVARYGLDVLALRVGRESVGGTPGM